MDMGLNELVIRAFIRTSYSYPGLPLGKNELVVTAFWQKM